MAIVNANGVDLRVSHYPSRAGDGSPVVVIIHGLMVDHAGLSFTLGMPLSVGAEVVLYDLRGHGRSQLVPTGYRVADHVADLIGLLDALDIDAPVHLAAGSFGGVIGLTAAIEHPERVASLTLIEPLLPYQGWGEGLAAGLQGVAAELTHGYTTEDAMQALGVASPRKAMGLARRAERLILETTLPDDAGAEAGLDRSAYARLRCPVQAIFGDRSHVFWLADHLREMVPDAELHVVPEADHMAIFLHTRTLKALIARYAGVVMEEPAPAATP